MTRQVSTANRFGFIQIRRELASPPPDATTGVRLFVAGKDDRYFVHLRTGRTQFSWQYYQAGFDTTESWSEVRLPLDAFSASGALLDSLPVPYSLRSGAAFAFGRDHDARNDYREVGFY